MTFSQAGMDVFTSRVILQVSGYVRGTSKYGVFVALAPGVDARVKMSNLADSFVEDAAAKFVPGQLIKGHVVSLSEGK
jgi:predicted RNA-binding protein with RPS1 domain